MNYSGGEKENHANGHPCTDMSGQIAPLQTTTTKTVAESMESVEDILDSCCNKEEAEDEQDLLSRSFSLHCNMIDAVEQYAKDKGFMIAHHPKDYFTLEKYKEFFPDELYPEKVKPPRRGTIGCSSKSHGRVKNCECTFRIMYHWDTCKKTFIFSLSSDQIETNKNGTVRPGSNLSHNHPLAPQLAVYDGREIVDKEKFVTADELKTIEDQSLSRVNVAQMRFNLEELYPTRTFCAKMLHRMKAKYIKSRYGEGGEGHDLRDLFKKGDLIRQLGGIFEVIPDENFSVRTIHCQTKLMKEYAHVYGDFKMADGTHSITIYDKVYIFWFVVDCLANSKIVGVTVNFTEMSVDISDGVRLFFGHEFAVADTLRVGEIAEIARYYNPFVDNEFDVNMPTSTVSSLDCAATADALRHETTNMPLNASVATPAFMTPPSDMSHETTMPSSISILEDSNVLSSASPDSSAPAFMTDEGPSFPLVAESAGWNHLLDRKHFTQQIMSSWAGLQDPQQFKSDVHSLLDLANADLFESELALCLDEYRTDKAQQLLKKISLLKHKLAYAYTKHYFTAGHVSDQRCEGGMSAIKANGKLSLMLSNGTYSTAQTRIQQVTRDHDIAALEEMKYCRINLMKTGKKYAAQFLLTKASALKYQVVKQVSPLCTTQWTVKEREESTAEYLVDVNGDVEWRGKKFTCVTCTCSFYTSTRMICPCGCAVMQRMGMDIDSIQNVHPYWHQWYHPLWGEALQRSFLPDYEDSPNRISPTEPTHYANTTITGLCHYNNNDSNEESTRHFNGEIFQQVGNLNHLTTATRVSMLRQTWNDVEKIASKTALGHKLAMAALIETSNRLKSMNLTDTNSIIRPNAFSKSLR
jgi:hypothetical protein